MPSMAALTFDGMPATSDAVSASDSNGTVRNGTVWDWEKGVGGYPSTAASVFRFSGVDGRG